MGAWLNSIKNNHRPMSSSPSSSNVHDTKLCKNPPQIIPLTNSSLGLQQFHCDPIPPPGFAQPLPCTVSRRSLLFSHLGLFPRTASPPPRIAYFVDDTRYATPFSIEAEHVTLVTDCLGVRARVITPGRVASAKPGHLLANLSIVSPGSTMSRICCFPRDPPIFSSCSSPPPFPFLHPAASTARTFN